MATVLENYQTLCLQVGERMQKEPVSADMLWWYGELVFRIGVLETLQAYLNAAPLVMERPRLEFHYKMLDAYVQSITLDRKYGPNRGPDTQKERDTAEQSLTQVVQDYRKRFSSFKPQNEESYRSEVNRVVQTVLPAWLQMRDTFVPLKLVKGKVKTS